MLHFVAVPEGSIMSLAQSFLFALQVISVYLLLAVPLALLVAWFLKVISPRA
jgi:hypothetical protein